MRAALAILSIVGVFLSTAPAQAGKVVYADGQGRWVSTACVKPEVPSALTRDPELAAETINARMAAHNDFVAKAGEYMACLSREAESDAQGFSQMIVKSAQEAIAQTEADIARSAELVKKQ